MTNPSEPAMWQVAQNTGFCGQINVGSNPCSSFFFFILDELNQVPFSVATIWGITIVPIVQDYSKNYRKQYM